MTQTMLSDTIKKNKRRSTPVHFGLCLSKNSTAVSTAVICACMHLLGMPAVLISVMIHMSDMLKADTVTGYFDYFDGSIPYIVIGCIALIVAFLSGSNAAMSCFAHLYDKQKVDMELSLPLSGKQRFISGYLSGLGIYIIPYIAVQAISVILFYAERFMFDGKTLTVTVSEKNYETTFDFFRSIFPVYIKAAAGLLVIMIMFYTMWVLTMSFCGSKLEAVLYGTGANLIMPALFVSVYFIICREMYGAVAETYLTLGDTLFGFLASCTSPAGAAAALLQYILKGTDMSFPAYIISVLAVTAVFFFAAMFVYGRRKAEDTGKSFAVKGFYYFVLSCMVFLAYAAMLTYFKEYTVPIVIVSAAAYIMLDCLSARGVKKIGRSFVKYVYTSGICFGLFFLITSTGCLGTEYTVPDVSEISSAELYGYSGYTNALDSFSSYYPHTQIFTFSDDETVKMITDMHRTHIEHYKKNPKEIKKQLSGYFGYAFGEYEYNKDLDVSNGTLRIIYKLKNGLSLSREYQLYHGALEKLSFLDTTDEAKENFIRELSEAYLGLKEYKNIKVTIKNKRNYKERIMTDKIPDDFFDRLTEMFAEDIGAVTPEEYLHPKRPSFGLLDVEILNDSGVRFDGKYIDIPAYFRRTAEYLKSLGLDFDELDQNGFDDYFGQSFSYFTIEKCCPSYSIPMESSAYFFDRLMSVSKDTTYDENVDYSDVTIHSIYHYISAYEDLYYNHDHKGLYLLYEDIDPDDKEKFGEILTNSVNSYIPDSECYVIIFTLGFQCYYVPEQYSSTVEELYEKYKDKGFLWSQVPESEIY